MFFKIIVLVTSKKETHSGKVNDLIKTGGCYDPTPLTIFRRAFVITLIYRFLVTFLVN